MLDRNGLVLATSVPVPSCGRSQGLRRPTPRSASQLARLLGMPPAELDERCRAGRGNFVWLRRQVDEPVWDQIKALGIKGIYQQREYKRKYPEGEAAAHVVGFTNIDETGPGRHRAALPDALRADGSRTVVRDRLGRVVEDMGDQVDPVRRPRHQLSIDSKVQFFAYQRVRDAVPSTRPRPAAWWCWTCRPARCWRWPTTPATTPAAQPGRRAAAQPRR
jgi:cell division protein FtsI (penicillin-binding protein 3)